MGTGCPAWAVPGSGRRLSSPPLEIPGMLANKREWLLAAPMGHHGPVSNTGPERGEDSTAAPAPRSPGFGPAGARPWPRPPPLWNEGPLPPRGCPVRLRGYPGALLSQRRLQGPRVHPAQRLA